MPDTILAPPALQLRPLSPALGVEVAGLDLRQPPDDDTAAALRAAMAEHQLLLFRDQELSAAEQSRFAQVFGRIEIRKSHYEGVAKPEFADQQHVSNARADGILGQGELTLHGDHFWHEEPLTHLILYGIECPTEGGDTRFCHSGLAQAAMPAALRQQLAGLRCLHMFDFRGGDYAQGYDAARVGEPGVASARHPILWHDPVTGLDAIWYNASSTVEVEGIAPAERPALTAALRQYLDDPQYNYLHRWRPGDLLVWRNRALLHARTPFDPSQRRTLRRTPIL